MSDPKPREMGTIPEGPRMCVLFEGEECGPEKDAHRPRCIEELARNPYEQDKLITLDEEMRRKP